MHAPIVVNYVPDGEDWAITVAQDQQQRTAKAAGLIAARHRADQLVAQLAPNAASRTVVHLLDGDAYAFTTSYLQARLGIQVPDPAESSVPPVEPAARTGEVDAPDAPAADSPVPDSPAVDVHTGTLPLQAG